MSINREKESSNYGYSGYNISLTGRRSSIERKKGRWWVRHVLLAYVLKAL
jgi:hypothetical protein